MDRDKCPSLNLKPLQGHRSVPNSPHGSSALAADWGIERLLVDSFRAEQCGDHKRATFW